MPRSALLVVAAAAVTLAAVALGGCRPAADAQPVGSPGGSGAGAQGTEVDGSPAEPGSSRSRSDGGGSGLAGSLVAVVMTKSGDAGPCERVCGSLGDCLLADDEYSTAVAGRLELACLDLCVHAPDDHPGKRELLACGGQACPELAACAARNWAALEAGSSRAEPGAVLSNTDPCVETCRWMVSCTNTQQPPSKATINPEQDKYCAQVCEEDSERNMMMTVAECVLDHCSDINAMYECWSRAMGH